MSPAWPKSTREQDVNQTTRQELEKAAAVERKNESGAAHAQ
jgi:hypothetical protein